MIKDILTKIKDILTKTRPRSFYSSQEYQEQQQKQQQEAVLVASVMKKIGELRRCKALQDFPYYEDGLNIVSNDETTFFMTSSGKVCLRYWRRDPEDRNSTISLSDDDLKKYILIGQITLDQIQVAIHWLND